MIQQQHIPQFDEFSIRLTKSLSKTTKKEFGIFFTPQSIIRDLTTKVLENVSIKCPNILEPSCGSCEFIRYLDNTISGATITGIEYNDEIYREIKPLETNGTFSNNTIHIDNVDYMKTQSLAVYDIIIGNPPYFVCTKESVPSKYSEYISGRPNIFGLFILHALSQLKNGGILAFIIPKSFLNSSYYSLIRNHIRKTCQIVEIKDYSEYNDFLETAQETISIVLRKNEEHDNSIETCEYSIKINENWIFTHSAQLLKELLKNTHTLKQLGFSVKTGNVVWNQKKELLTSNSSEDTSILLYNTNITNDNKIQLTEFKNGEKGQYIRLGGTTEPSIVVNRGNGNSAYNFKYALVNQKTPYLVENHLNVITSVHKKEHEVLMKEFEVIIRSFKNPKTQQFIELFFGNGGLSKTELETTLPIYID